MAQHVARLQWAQQRGGSLTDWGLFRAYGADRDRFLRTSQLDHDPVQEIIGGRESSGGMEWMGVWDYIFQVLNFKISRFEICQT